MAEPLVISKAFSRVRGPFARLFQSSSSSSRSSSSSSRSLPSHHEAHPVGARDAPAHDDPLWRREGSSWLLHFVAQLHAAVNRLGG
jgi:hypothetical protein